MGAGGPGIMGWPPGVPVRPQAQPSAAGMAGGADFWTKIPLKESVGLAPSQA